MPQRKRRGTRRVPSAIYRGRQAQAKLRPRRARRGHEASIVESSVTARSRDAWWHASQGFSSANTTLSTCASGAATIARHSSSSQSERTSRSWLQQPRRHRCCSRTRRARRSTRQLAAGRRRHRPSFVRCSSRPWLQMSSARRLSYGRAEAAIARAVPADGPLGAYCKRWVPAGWRGLPSSSKSSPRIAASPVVSRPERGSAVCLSELAAVCEAGTRSSGRRPVRYRVTANSCQSSGTPFSVWLPRSSNRRPEPATRSLTVRETSTSPASASEDTRAPMCTAMPLRSAPAALALPGVQSGS